MFFVYDIDTYKINGIYTSDVGIKINDNELIKFIKTNNFSQTDIRAYNDDGSVKSLGQQIKEKILVLKDNEVIKDGVVVELNPSYEDDYIKLVQRKLEKLEDDKKIEYQVEYKKYSIVEKTIEEKLEDNIISVDEYNEYVNQLRQCMYISQLDSKRYKLLDSILKRFSDENILLDSEKELLSEILKIREDIKSQYKKI